MTAVEITYLIHFAGAILVASMAVGMLAMTAGTYLLAGHFRDGLHANIAWIWAIAVATVASGVIGASLQFVMGFLPAEAILPFLKSVLALSAILLLAWVTCLAFFLEAWKQLVRRRKGHVGERQVARALKRFGYVALNDVFVRNGSEIAQLDHVVVAGSRLLVLETKNFGGDVYGQASDENWTIRNEDKDTYTVRNPLRQNDRQVRILNAAFGVKAEGWVVLGRMSATPKGTPERVVGIGSLVGLLNHLSSQAQEGTDEDREKAIAVLDAIKLTDQAVLRREHRRTWSRESWEQPTPPVPTGTSRPRTMDAATTKQVEFGTSIAQVLGIEAPTSDDKAAWGAFISENLTAYNASQGGRRWKGAA